MEKVKNRNNLVIGEYLNGILGERLTEDILKAWEKKLKIIEEIEKMDLPVDEWEKMEEEIMRGAIE